MKRYKIISILLYILFVYQAVISFLVLINLKTTSQGQDALFIVATMSIHMYILFCNTKDSAMQYIRFRRRVSFIDVDESEEALLKAYMWRRRLFLLIVIIIAFLALSFALPYIMQHIEALLANIINIFGVSALLIVLLSISLGVKAIVDFIKKKFEEESGVYLTYKVLILQNFLISVNILRLISSIQI